MNASQSRFEAEFGGPQPANVYKTYDVSSDNPEQQMLTSVMIERPSGSLQLTSEVWDYMLVQASINQAVQTADE